MCSVNLPTPATLWLRSTAAFGTYSLKLVENFAMDKGYVYQTLPAAIPIGRLKLASRCSLDAF